MTAGDDQLTVALDEILAPHRELPAFVPPPNLWDELSARGFVVTEVADPHGQISGYLMALCPDGQLGVYVFDWQPGSVPE